MSNQISNNSTKPKNNTSVQGIVSEINEGNIKSQFKIPTANKKKDINTLISKLKNSQNPQILNSNKPHKKLNFSKFIDNTTQDELTDFDKKNNLNNNLNYHSGGRRKKNKSLRKKSSRKKSSRKKSFQYKKKYGGKRKSKVLKKKK